VCLRRVPPYEVLGGWASGPVAPSGFRCASWAGSGDVRLIALESPRDFGIAPHDGRPDARLGRFHRARWVPPYEVLGGWADLGDHDGAAYALGELVRRRRPRGGNRAVAGRGCLVDPHARPRRDGDVRALRSFARASLLERCRFAGGGAASRAGVLPLRRSSPSGFHRTRYSGGGPPARWRRADSAVLLGRAPEICV